MFYLAFLALVFSGVAVFLGLPGPGVDITFSHASFLYIAFFETANISALLRIFLTASLFFPLFLDINSTVKNSLPVISLLSIRINDIFGVKKLTFTGGLLYACKVKFIYFAKKIIFFDKKVLDKMSLVGTI